MSAGPRLVACRRRPWPRCAELNQADAGRGPRSGAAEKNGSDRLAQCASSCRKDGAARSRPHPPVPDRATSRAGPFPGGRPASFSRPVNAPRGRAIARPGSMPRVRAGIFSVPELEFMPVFPQMGGDFGLRAPLASSRGRRIWQSGFSVLQLLLQAMSRSARPKRGRQSVSSPLQGCGSANARSPVPDLREPRRRGREAHATKGPATPSKTSGRKADSALHDA